MVHTFNIRIPVDVFNDLIKLDRVVHERIDKKLSLLKQKGVICNGQLNIDYKPFGKTPNKKYVNFYISFITDVVRNS